MARDLSGGIVVINRKGKPVRVIPSDALHRDVRDHLTPALRMAWSNAGRHFPSVDRITACLRKAGQPAMAHEVEAIVAAGAKM